MSDTDFLYVASLEKRLEALEEENNRLKGLLKSAISDFERVTKMYLGIQCDSCHHNFMRNYDFDCCEWQYKDEALKLIGGAENG